MIPQATVRQAIKIRLALRLGVAALTGRAFGDPKALGADRPMYELIGGGGACYKTSGRRDMGRPIGKISLTVESLDVYEMASAWKKP
jgi:hypothetical protein